MLGIDGKQIAWVVASIKWLVKAMQALAAKQGVNLEAPPSEG